MTHLLQPGTAFLQAARRRITALLGAYPRRPWIVRAVSRVTGSWVILALLFLGFRFSHWMVAEKSPGIRNAGLAFLLQLLILAFSGHLSGARNHRHHAACSWWPFPEEAVVDLLLRQALVRGIGFACAGAVGFAATASVLSVGSRPLGWVLQGAVIGLWVVPLGVLFDGLNIRWRWVSRYQAAIFFSGMAYFLVLRRFPPLGLWLDQHGDAVALAMPSGWLILPWADWLEGRASIRWGYLAPMVLALLTLPLAWRQLRAAGRFRERTLFLLWGEIPENAPQGFVDQIHTSLAEAQAAHLPGPTANADAILSRAFLVSPLADPPGWVQRQVWRWWTPEQRIAAECMVRGWNRRGLADGIGWASMACAWGALLMSKRSEESQWFAGAVVSGMVAIITLVPWLSAFFQVGVIRMFPIRLQAVAALRWKDTAVRCLVAVPSLVLGGTVAAGINGDPLEVGALIGFQVALTPVVLSPLATLYGLLNPVRLRGTSGAFLKVVVAVVCLINILSVLLQFLPLLGLITGTLCLGLNAVILHCGNRWFDACRIDTDIPASTMP